MPNMEGELMLRQCDLLKEHSVTVLRCTFNIVDVDCTLGNGSYNFVNYNLLEAVNTQAMEIEKCSFSGSHCRNISSPSILGVYIGPTRHTIGDPGWSVLIRKYLMSP